MGWYGRVWWVGPVSHPLAVGCDGMAGFGGWDGTVGFGGWDQ